jgi:hypothetical protein
MPKHLLLVVIQESKSVDDMFLNEDEGGCNLSIISIHCMATSSFDGTCWIGSMPFSIACRHQRDQYLQFP